MDFFNNAINLTKTFSLKILPLNKEMLMFYYFAILNVFAFFLIGIDKYKSRKRKYRVKEIRFMLISLIGGALGCVMGMTVYRHKTQKPMFYVGIPIIFLLNLVMYFYIYKYLIKVPLFK